MTRRTAIATVASIAALQLKADTPAATLPPLGYATDALEPFIDAQTMEIHHDKHHKAYVNNLNKALAGNPELAAKPLDQLLKNLADVPEPIRNAVRNNGGGHANHSLFWQTLAKGKGPAKGKLRAAINKSFGGQSALEDKLKSTGLTIFGSGWVWLIPDGGDGLTIETSPNQDSPLMRGRAPLFGIDVWEHAYYLKYQNRRADYLAAFVNVINWDFASQRFEEISK